MAPISFRFSDGDQRHFFPFYGDRREESKVALGMTRQLPMHCLGESLSHDFIPCHDSIPVWFLEIEDHVRWISVISVSKLSKEVRELVIINRRPFFGACPFETEPEPAPES
jgi:hypothetical protein